MVAFISISAAKRWSPTALNFAPDGRIRLTLWDKGLRSDADAIETISHELNHIRGFLKNGVLSSEVSAEKAAEAASKHTRK